ncbi:MAG: acetyl-CoA carboxylase carboxyltransferase subunit alpha [Bdellovibrionales bacterium]|nr:acetyl-CoA carboxylase carboxyltransferase subunit alpha [Bdellovibrionales bacterium]
MSSNQYLDFEQPVIEAEEELLRLRAAVENGDLSVVNDVEKSERKLEKLREDVYGNLSPYQRVRLSRHLERPFTLDYVERMTTGFVELHGDRLFGDDPAIVGGLAKLNNHRVMIVGHQRGRSTQERVRRNFGMPQPEGNRKAQRLFSLAEKFKLPLIQFVDTQGAYPGMEGEARGQAEAIARNLLILSGLTVPIISVVIGEGGSGGALALGVCDRLLMLENAIYSVITPEGCASILWGKSDADNVGEYAKVASESLKLTAYELKDTGVVDEVVKEPVGGAHRDHDSAAELVKQSIAKHLFELTSMSIDELLEQRYQKFRHIGGYA